MTYVEIVKVNKTNFSDLFNLIIKLAEYEKLDPPSPDSKERLLSHLGKYYEGYLAFYENKPVGYIIFFMAYSSFLAKPTLFLEDLFVLEEYRNKGIGKKLFRFCVKKAKEKNCGRLDWTVLDWNSNAISFYKKHGAKHLKEWLYFRLTEDKIDELVGNENYCSK
ncbi:GNAT family N-acetyltransferase [Candidatus Woesearchaeota archaeon]|nr:GNAT family N-acetyltransferase [Candidatus Woesearchaeota archaeon]